MAVLISVMAAAGASGEAQILRHVVVYRAAGRFGGWPANHGLWSWNNEILVGFSAAWFQLKTPDRHQYDKQKPEEPRLARSLDGGLTWTVEAPASLLPPEQGGAAAADLPEPMNFLDPNFAMTMRFTNSNTGPSRLWYSVDRGKSWKGPYRFPLLGQSGIMARTDYIVDTARDAFVFLTASKSNGREGRVLCARTADGGLTWKFVSWIGPEPAGFSIMPSSVRLSSNIMLTATRVHESETQNAIDLYRSGDNGGHWTFLSRPVPQMGRFNGNPPSLIRLRDGRLCITYASRNPPYGIRARLSRDNGTTWTGEIILRNDGASWDQGYTRSTEAASGDIVTVYYFAEQPDQEREIAATVWRPDR